jgi:hypothetical protein
MTLNDIFKRTGFQNIYTEGVKTLNTKFEILNNVKLPKFKWSKQKLLF